MGVNLRVAFFVLERWEEILITVNGRIADDAEGLSLAAYLAREGYTITRVAVECNGEIIPKAKYEEKILDNGDIVEIVHFVGGG